MKLGPTPEALEKRAAEIAAAAAAEAEETGEIRPGFASEEQAEDAEPLPKNLEVAHYGGVTDVEAAGIWEAETLCLTCLCAGVCRIAVGTREPLVVVSRCLAYLPTSG